MSVAAWIADLRWAMNVRRARSRRRRLSLSGRLRFDAALRHRLKDGAVVAYPDAFYCVEIEDLIRAIRAASPLYDVNGKMPA